MQQVTRSCLFVYAECQALVTSTSHKLRGVQCCQNVSANAAAADLFSGKKRQASSKTAKAKQSKGDR